MKAITKIVSILLLFMLNACAATKLAVTSVSYQSIRNEHTDVNTIVPKDARILVRHIVSPSGDLEVLVQNLTDSTMIIDRTMSFFVNSDGMSTSYYDPTIQTTTTTDMASSTKGATVNLGAVAGALGVGGVAGRVLSGVNVGGSSTGGQAVSNTTYTVDQPSVAIGPRGQVGMARVFKIDGVGTDFLSALSSQNTSRKDLHIVADNAEESMAKFSVVISFSVDGGKKYENVVSDYYTDDMMVCYVKEHGRTNAPLRNILSQPNVLCKGWNVLYFNISHPDGDSKQDDTYQNCNTLFDYK